MKLGEFIKNFSHNNLIRLHYKIKGGHENITGGDWNEVSMDWEVNKGKGIYRHYIDNEVLELVSILIGGAYPEAINICIEKLENQPFIEELEELEEQFNMCDNGN